MLGLWLEELGLPFEEAASGEEALQRCSGRRYDAVVLDQRMPPGLSGVEVAQRLWESGYDARVVLHSAYLDPAVEAAAAALHLPTVEKGDQTGLLEMLRAVAA